MITIGLDIGTTSISGLLYNLETRSVLHSVTEELASPLRVNNIFGSECRTPKLYGLATHYYNLHHGLVPEEAFRVCTIADYIAMKLSGRSEPLIDATQAADPGCGDWRVQLTGR